MQAAGGARIAVVFTERLLQCLSALIQVRRLGLAVLLVKLAPRKDIGAAEHLGLAVPLDQQHLHALGTIAQQHHGRGGHGRCQHLLLIDFNAH